MRPDPDRDRGLAELGANARLHEVIYRPEGGRWSHEESVARLNAYKAELKKRKADVALECHPDRTGDLPEEERELRRRRFVCISRAVDFVLDLKIAPPRAAPVGRWVVVPVDVRSVTSTTTSATSSWTASVSWVAYSGV